MSDRFHDNEAARESLSALADGEAQSQDVARACGAWRDQADAQLTWRAYQLIGDVMRSEELVKTSDGDAFLRKFQARLAQEPVVLAPHAAPAASRGAAPQQAVAPVAPLRRRNWMGPVSVAAGFVLVVGALVSSQILPSGAGRSNDAAMAQSGGAINMASALEPSPAFTGAALVPEGRDHGLSLGGTEASFSRPGDVVMIRDPHLDQALALQRVSGAGERSFAGQGEGLRQQVVFDGR